jgi:LmbE family N-acetylglucosaminyl deacetylase
MYLQLLKRALPLPEITAGETYLFVGAHPDDIEVGTGGSVAKLIEMKKAVYFAIITDGGCGYQDLSLTKVALVETRKKEALTSATEFGVKDTFFLGFPDAGDYKEEAVAKELAKIILNINPDFVFAPDPNLPSEIHPDHLKAGNAVKLALLYCGYPLVYQENVGEVPNDLLQSFRFRNLGFYFTHRANKFMRLNQNHVQTQRKAILCHGSQFSNTDEFNQIMRYLSIRGRIFGSLGKRSKEGFFVLGKMHQHCFPEVNRY